jgi:YidC/Oxa1 family membrane protein insertase
MDKGCLGRYAHGHWTAMVSCAASQGSRSRELMPRWATIAALTISIRLCLFPLVVRMTKHNIRFQAVNPQFTALMKRLNEAKQTRDQAQMSVVTQNLQGLMKEHDVSPFRAFTLPLVQMPFFLSMFYGLRNFAYTPLPQLKEGGFSWVTDLTMPDPFWILPITSMALTNLVLIVSLFVRYCYQD